MRIISKNEILMKSVPEIVDNHHIFILINLPNQEPGVERGKSKQHY